MAPTLTAEELLAAVDPDLPLPMALVKLGLTALADMNPADLDGAASLDLARELLTASDRVRALALRAVADVDKRDLWALDGAPSTGTWVADQPSSMPRADVTLARRLEVVPQVAAAVAEGGLSLDDAVLLQRALSKLRQHVDRPDGRIDGQDGEQALCGVIVNGVTLLAGAACGGLAEDDPRIVQLHTTLTDVVSAPLPQLTRLETAFLHYARWASGDLLRRGLAELVDALLPNELEKRSREAENARGFEVRRHTDRQGSRVSGDLDDEATEYLLVLLNAAEAMDADNPVDTRAAATLREQGLDPYDPDLPISTDRPRGKAQRLHDAFKLLLKRSIDSGALGSSGKQPVHVGITISNAALHDQPGAMPPRTDSGRTIPLSLARRWLCDSAITRFVLGLGGRVLSASHTERTLKPHERKIKHLETSGICQTAGCQRGHPTGHTLIPHHVIPYATCGSTSLTDTALLCEQHHADLHVGSRPLRLKDGRHLNEHGWLS
jgi:hypothetical protein